MSIALRLKVMSFCNILSGSWLVTLGSYMINTLHFTGANVGMVYSSKGIAAIIMRYNGDHRRQMAACRTCIHAVSRCVRAYFYAASVTDRI